MGDDKGNLVSDTLTLLEALILIIILVPIIIVAYPIHWITKKVFE